MLILWIYF